MSVKETEIKMHWRTSNKRRYIELGYNFTNYNDVFNVKIEDVPRKSEIEITSICDICGKEKPMSFHAYNHITNNGQKAYKCRECFIKEKELPYEIILKEVELEGYSLATPRNEYKNGSTRIRYICPLHGEQSMKASNFHNGRRCPKCFFDKARKRYAFPQEEICEIVKSMGGELLNPQDYINQNVKNLKIKCPRCHDNIFITSLQHFKQHGGQSCPECYRKESVGERRIRQWLENNNIAYISEKWFDDCRDKNPLPFDFYLPVQNTIIEFDGKQHFEETHFFAHQSKKIDSITSYTQYHDTIKNEYCISNNINLIRIPYTQINNIEKILEEKIIA